MTLVAEPETEVSRPFCFEDFVARHGDRPRAVGARRTGDRFEA